MIGQTLGHYRIVEKLGAGGMGEVYRAHDPRLGRDVALKVIAGDEPASGERLRRFEREARAVASLGHPNILAVHDVGTDEGRSYVVFELLEGETLRERLQGGPLAVRKAVAFAAQIGKGLAAAHSHGVVHRDLKPENLFLTRGGDVKILDFGLAQQAARGADDDSRSPTLPKDTAAGVLLGTVGYMSPEQARGETADHRSDIFALGAVLYEMLSGRRAFRGATAIETLHAILKEEPAELAPELGVPPGLDRVVRHCLEKTREDRFQSAGDVVFALDAVAGGSGSTAGAVPAAPHRVPWRGLAAGGLAILAAASGYLWGRAGRPPAQTRGAVRFLVTPPAAAPNIGGFRVAPDGRSLAFVAWGQRSSLWLRSLADSEPRPVPGTENAGQVMWSPDSRRLAFASGGALKTIDLAGGTPVTVTQAKWPLLGDWSRDGLILFTDIDQGAALFRVPATGGEPARVTSPAPGETHSWPSFLADGRRFLYEGDWFAKSSVLVGALDARESQSLLKADSQAVYSATGHVLFVRGRALLAQPLDARTLRLGEAPMALADDVWTDSVWGVADFSASQNGVLAYRRQPRADRELVWLDRSGRALGTVGTAGRWQDPDLSADGTRLVVTSEDSSSASQLWIFDLVRGFSSQPLPDVAMAGTGLWSRDGRHLFYRSREADGVAIYRRSVDGMGMGERLLADRRVNSLCDVSADDRSLVFDRWGQNGLGDLFVLPLDGDRKPWALEETPSVESWGRVSPDGRFVAYAGTGVFVQPFPPTGKRWQVSAGDGGYPAWRSDGRELFYLRGGTLMAVDVRPGSARPSFGPPRILFKTPPLRGPARSPYVVHPDGQRFLFVKELESRESQPIVVVSDWLADQAH